MKRNKSLMREWVLGALIVAALVLLINPWDILMSFGVEMTIIIAVALAVTTFAIYIWREQPADEREAHNGLKSARLAYFAAGFVLLCGIGYQTLTSHIDPWLPIALSALVAAKLMSSTWLSRL
jgi:uncharacterized membrane protein